MTVLIIFSFLSGVVTILSPCILPVLPIVLTGSLGDRKRPYGIVTGFILSFSILSLTLNIIIDYFRIPPDSLRTIAVIILIIFGFTLVIPKLKEIFMNLVSRVNINNSGKQRKGFSGGVIIGFTLGVVWAPCVGPIMASVIALAATQSVNIYAVFIIISYSIGTSIPMLLIILGSKKILTKNRFLKNNTKKIQKLFGVIMIFLGIALNFNLDRKFQTWILEIFPKYGTGLTNFENNSLVKNALKNESSERKEGVLGYYGKVPEFISDGIWLNNKSEIESIEDLKGKVVIIDFWTYSCINCIRTIPYLKDWYSKYRDSGLEIVGIHTPEFVFERSSKNVLQAMEDLGVIWPVMQDNFYKQWKLYNNKYWPAKYILDREGNLRYIHFGEGEYQKTENVIRYLLEESGLKLEKNKNIEIEDKLYSSTPETYLGYSRVDNFISKDNLVKEKPALYTITSELKENEWGLNGEWIFSSDFITPESKGELLLNFRAKDVYLVIEPDSNKTGVINIFIDNKFIKQLQPTESKLYKIADFEKSGIHKIKLQVDGRIKLFAFTFG